MRPAQMADPAGLVRHVFLRDMVLAASIGVHGFEHQAPQRIRINVDLAVADEAPHAELRGAEAEGIVGRDELSRVVDYEKVADGVRAIVAARHVRLVETLAERIAQSCLADPRVRVVRVRVEKLDIFADTAAVGVEIERSQAAAANDPANNPPRA